MRFFRIVLLAWIVTGLGALVGAIIGGIWQDQGRFIGASIFATMAVLLTVRIATSRGWLDFERRRGASIGGLVGLAIAAPMAQMQWDMPMPFVPMGLVGILMIMAAGKGAVR